MSDRTLDAETWARLARLAEFGVLSASLLHELRQPLFAVKATAQLAQRREQALGPDGLAQLLAHVRQIEELLDHYTGFHRIEGAPITFDLGEEARHSVAMMTHRARQLRVQLTSALHSEPLMVSGRPGALRQVVTNLIHNGLDAAEGRDDPTVSVLSGLSGEWVWIEVRDNGPGIPSEVREHLFEPFVTSKSSDRGTGLGLHIARQLVADTGGTLVAEDAPGGGTAMRVRIPRQRAKPD